MTGSKRKNEETGGKKTKRAKVIATRAAKFKPAETNLLLDMVEEWLPAGPHMWDTVMLNYNRLLRGIEEGEGVRFPQRDMEGLKTRFKNLKNHPKKTGDPTCPADVVRAKRLWRHIETEWEVVGCEDEEGGEEYEEEEEDENDDEIVEEEEQEEPTAAVAPAAQQTPLPQATATSSQGVSITPRTLVVEPESTKKFKTSTRTGLTEEQLIAAGAKKPASATVKKRGVIDKQVAAIEREERSTMQMFMMMMEQNRESEARREERQAQRDENSQRMMMTFMAAMMNQNNK